VVLIDDGSTDKTAELALATCKKYPQLQVSIKSFPINLGKVAVFNEIVPTVTDEQIVFFSDASSSFSANVLKRANEYFNQPSVGVFCPRYCLKNNASEGEKKYWQYQSSIYQKESKLGTSIGYHGSGYAIRKSAWKELPENVINDDFIIPLRVIEQGYVGVYDVDSWAIEEEVSTQHQDWHRRIRIGAGNIQQVLLLWRLLLPSNGFIAWMFFSGKALRIIMPWLLIVLWLSNLILTLNGVGLFKYLWWAQNLFYLCAVFNFFVTTKVTQVISYFVMGHTALLLGWFSWFRMKGTGKWQRTNSIKKQYIHPVVFIGKWIIDKISGLIGVLLFLLCLPLVGIAIKLSSPGPILYRQLRVGQTTDTQTYFFFIYKFRTMHVNKFSRKSLWTKENDPRIYTLGNFLRKTHLDELPQFMNILKGDMSLVGPRPERPSLFPYIINEIPFYEERLYWVKPGLTGLAQTTYRYDTTIEDVRKKVACDHAYATYLTNPLIWLKTEVTILCKTVILVLLGKGF
ncbi:MAG: sugar transferase, partial [Legionella sp.]